MDKRKPAHVRDLIETTSVEIAEDQALNELLRWYGRLSSYDTMQRLKDEDRLRETARILAWAMDRRARRKSKAIQVKP